MTTILFEAIKIAYMSRLLFQTDNEFRNYVGVSYETIKDNKDNDDLVERYYDVLDQECHRQTGKDLLSTASAYLEASNVCRGIGFDWKKRRQIVSRKKFCRWLFRKSAAPKIELSMDEEFQFKPKDGDEEILKTFYPDGIENGRTIDLIFVILITFDVIKSVTDLETGRARDIKAKDVKQSIEKMLALVKILNEDIPYMGVTGKPVLFDDTIILLQTLAESDIEDEQMKKYTPAWFWRKLDSLENVTITTSSPQAAAETHVIPIGYRMNGIWIDDKDYGKTRFWIFPDNKLMAFCYVYDNPEWKLVPYEFCFYGTEYDDTVDDICIFASHLGNEQLLTHSESIADKGEIICLNFEKNQIDENGDYSEIRFYSDTDNIPEWCDWRNFRKLLPDENQYDRFMNALKSIYDPNSSESRLFDNICPLLTDALNCLVAVDLEYLYVSDIRKPDRFAMTCRDKDEEIFSYDHYYNHGEPKVNLLELEISPEQPLYLIPRFNNPSDRRDDRYRNFCEAVAETQLGHQITIYHNPKKGKSLLCFNKFSLVFELSELEAYGVRRYTSRERFLTE